MSLLRVVPRQLFRISHRTRLLSSYISPAPVQVEKEVATPQAPNYPAKWSTNQRERPGGQSGPRFEQTAMELQPNPLSAMELIANEPIIKVHGRRAVCDGGTSASCMQYFLNMPTFLSRRRSVGSPEDLHQSGTYLHRNYGLLIDSVSGPAGSSTLRVCCRLFWEQYLRFYNIHFLISYWRVLGYIDRSCPNTYTL